MLINFIWHVVISVEISCLL